MQFRRYAYRRPYFLRVGSRRLGGELPLRV